MVIWLQRTENHSTFKSFFEELIGRKAQVSGEVQSVRCFLPPSLPLSPIIPFSSSPASVSLCNSRLSLAFAASTSLWFSSSDIGQFFFVCLFSVFYIYPHFCHHVLFFSVENKPWELAFSNGLLTWPKPINHETFAETSERWDVEGRGHEAGAAKAILSLWSARLRPTQQKGQRAGKKLSPNGGFLKSESQLSVRTVLLFVSWANHFISCLSHPSTQLSALDCHWVNPIPPPGLALQFHD